MESDNIITIKGGVTTVNAYDDAINSGSDMTVEGGCVYARSTNNDGIDTNGNCYIKGGLVYAIGGNAPEVAIDANSEAQKKLYAASSWNKNTWYALTYGNETFAFQTPSSGGTTMVVSAPSTPSLQSGVSVSGGTEIFDGVAYTGASVSGGSSVTLSNYTGGNQGGGPGGGGRPGGR